MNRGFIRSRLAASIGSLALASLGFAAPAGAAPPPRGSWVVVAMGSCGDPHLGADAALIREALSSQVGPAVLSSEAAQDRFGVFPLSTLEDAERGFIAMQKRYVATEFAQSFNSALAVEAAFQRVPPSAEEDAARTELDLLTVESLIHGGEDALGQATIERLAELKPQVQLDPLRYPPSVERIWAVAKTHLASQELEAMHIEAPSGARIYLDGLLAGEAPLDTRVRSGESFDLQMEKGGEVSRHYAVSPASSSFTGALILADEARFRAIPEVCFDSRNLSTELAQGMLLRSLDVGGSGRFGTRPELVENIVLVSLDSQGNDLLSAALWSRSTAGVIRQAKIATVHGATNPDVAAKLTQFVATGERSGSDPLLLP